MEGDSKLLGNEKPTDDISIKANILNISICAACLLYTLITFTFSAIPLIIYILSILYFALNIFKAYSEKAPDLYPKKEWDLLLFLVRIFYALILLTLLVWYIMALETLEEMRRYYSLIGFPYISIMFFDLYAFVSYVPGWIYKYLATRKARCAA